MLEWLAAQESTGGLDWTEVLSSASPLGMLAIFIGALAAGKLILPREIDERDKRLGDRDKRILQLEAEKEEFKDMAFRALKVGERVVSVAEQRDST